MVQIHKINNVNKLIKSLLIILLINISCVFSQEEKKVLKLTEEEIVYHKYHKDSYKTFSMDGIVNDNLSFRSSERQNDVFIRKYYIFNEIDLSFKKTEAPIHDKIRLVNSNDRRDNLTYYSYAFSSSDAEILKLEYKDKVYTLDTIHSMSYLKANFSDDLKHIIVSTTSDRTDWHTPEIDDKLRIYNLENIDKGEIKKEVLPIKNPSNGMVVNNMLFFQKVNVKFKGISDLFQTDIYKTTAFNLKDTVKVAAYAKIRVISPDGKYILGSRDWDIPNGSTAIFNVETGKYQLLIGREYHKVKAFYSHRKKKFGFVFKGKIVYIDIPKEFPYDSFQRENRDLPDFFDVDFYKKHKHKPFKDEL